MLVLSTQQSEAIVVDLRPFGLGLLRLIDCGTRGKRHSNGIECDQKIRVVRQCIFDEDERQRELAGLPEPSPATREAEWEQRWMPVDLDLDIGNDISEIDEEAA